MRIRIVLDAVGGDNALAAPVHGAVLAARAYGCAVTLAGPQAVIAAELARRTTRKLDITIVDAPTLIAMDAHATQAVRRNPHSAQAIGLRLVRDGAADAFVSAGHSGATMAAATLLLGRLDGVERPALATLFPAFERPILVLDIGAIIDCTPAYLRQFAQMGHHYARHALGMGSPRIALLANGEEQTKGDTLVQAAHGLLRASTLHFVGNAEPKDALLGDMCDVLVCDGFVGNMFIKTAESIAKLVQTQAIAALKRHLAVRLLAGIAPTALLAAMSGRGRRVATLAGAAFGGPALIGAATIPPLRWLRQRADYRSYGGAPLLGLRGVAIIAHGRSDARAIMHALRQADLAAHGGITDMVV